jgi:hypothetical protein
MKWAHYSPYALSRSCCGVVRSCSGLGQRVSEIQNLRDIMPHASLTSALTVFHLALARCGLRRHVQRPCEILQNGAENGVFDRMLLCAIA